MAKIKDEMELQHNSKKCDCIFTWSHELKHKHLTLSVITKHQSFVIGDK